jgi:hypothetical protein
MTLKILVLMGLVVTTAILIIGVVNTWRTTATGTKSNQFMRWRVIAQAVTLVLFATLLWLGKH